MTARDRDIARGRVQVLQSGCRHMVESLGSKRESLSRIGNCTATFARCDDVDAALDRAATALLDAIDELVVLDRDIAASEVPA